MCALAKQFVIGSMLSLCNVHEGKYTHVRVCMFMNVNVFLVLFIKCCFVISLRWLCWFVCGKMCAGACMCVRVRACMCVCVCVRVRHFVTAHLNDVIC